MRTNSVHLHQYFYHIANTKWYVYPFHVESNKKYFNDHQDIEDNLVETETNCNCYIKNSQGQYHLKIQALVCSKYVSVILAVINVNMHMSLKSRWFKEHCAYRNRKQSSFFLYAFTKKSFLILSTCSETRIKDGLQGDTRGEMKQTKT